MEEPLLGQLVRRFAFFTRFGELLCVAALHSLLADREIEKAFLDLLADRSTIDEIRQLRRPLFWKPEATQDDRGRPDLEGRVGDLPVIKIEAKLDAVIDHDQLESYAVDQVARCTGRDPVAFAGLLVLLVPARRIGEARDQLAAWRGVSKQSTVVSVQLAWEDVLECLDGACGENRRDDLRQFKALYHALMSISIGPFEPGTPGEQWAEQRDELVQLVEAVSRALTREFRPGDRVLPIHCVGEYLKHRAVYDPTAETWFCLGLWRPPLQPMHPDIVWIRFQPEAPYFDEITRRLNESVYEPGLVLEDAYLWLPIPLPPDLAGEPLVKAVAELVRNALNVAWGNLGPSTPSARPIPD